jgi:hypothetical protein
LAGEACKPTESPAVPGAVLELIYLSGKKGKSNGPGTKTVRISRQGGQDQFLPFLPQLQAISAGLPTSMRLRMQYLRGCKRQCQYGDVVFLAEVLRSAGDLFRGLGCDSTRALEAEEFA